MTVDEVDAKGEMEVGGKTTAETGMLPVYAGSVIGMARLL